ncbi:MAG: hypothetical protein ISR89_10175 [Candidatus Marinimicrobia bacterium]|nr:hypothetical protein [Candidatus Neomarinimicrobiota bacterium]MBL7031519.1 hypothetical protein [Candidatus Neomarinimicrobiota bacterium]
MKRLVLITIFLFGCEKFDLKTDNPLDPNNPEYVQPTISILSPSDQETITTDKVDITFQGNELVNEYRYEIITTDIYKATDWSDWSASNTLSLEFLNEHTYTVNAQSRYLTEETSEDASVTFTIDALQPSSLLLYPKQIYPKANVLFKIDLYAHDLENVSALEFVIEFDNTKMDFSESESQVYGDVNVVFYNGTSKIYYTLGVYNSQTGFEKNQLIAEPYFLIKSNPPSSSSTIKISSVSAKTFDGQTIEVVETNQSQVVIQ